MAKLRPLQHGHVYQKGPSWFLQYREDIRNEAGEIERKRFKVKLAPLRMPDGRAVTKREAERMAWDQVLSKLNIVSLFPATLATVSEYWQQHFAPGHVATLKAAGQRHYGYLWPRIEAELGQETLRAITPEHIAAFLAKLSGESKSAQTVVHYRNALGALFRHAAAAGAHPGPNPARAVKPPRMVRTRRQVLQLSEAWRLVEALASPTRELVYLSMMTSLNVAEMVGLDRRHVNLGGQARLEAEGLIPAASLAVWQNCYEGELDTTKTDARRRIVPLTPRLVAMLEQLAAGAKRKEDDAPFFQNRRGGRIDPHNLANRQLAPAARQVLGRRIGWHLFRHCAASWADLVQMPLAERVAMLGHATAQMTLYYSHDDIERRRPYLAELEQQLEAAGRPPAPEPAAPLESSDLERLIQYEATTIQ